MRLKSMSRMTEIRDPVHGYVKLDSLASELSETPQMQRLRWIKQLGLACLVYPGANHTRFEHSLGTYHLAGVLADHLGLEEEDRLMVGATALLHDVGHGPLSHATEAALAPYLRRSHENAIETLRKGELKDVLDRHGLTPGEMQSLISGNGIGEVVSGEIDVDRMDYLLRDAHYTGVAYGVIDHPRLLQKMRLHQGQLVMEAGGIQAAASLLISRLLMHPAVYYHHVCRISECMIAAGIRRMIDEGASASAIRTMDDIQLFTALERAGGLAGEIGLRIRSRRLFKRAVYVGLESLDPSLLRVGEKALSLEIAEAAGVDADQVLVDSPALPDTPEGSFPALVAGEIKTLRDVSPLVAILERAHKATWRFGVYTPSEMREQVSKAARRCLNLKKSTVQHTFSDIDNDYL
ncbi:MAG TPA: HD domain-containing protein [Methanothrix sp.]|nr:HD domain-containing protein [Methanothrix sp.]